MEAKKLLMLGLAFLGVGSVLGLTLAGNGSPVSVATMATTAKTKTFNKSTELTSSDFGDEHSVEFHPGESYTWYAVAAGKCDDGTTDHSEIAIADQQGYFNSASASGDFGGDTYLYSGSVASADAIPGDDGYCGVYLCLNNITSVTVTYDLTASEGSPILQWWTFTTLGDTYDDMYVVEDHGTGLTLSLTGLSGIQGVCIEFVAPCNQDDIYDDDTGEPIGVEYHPSSATFGITSIVATWEC